MNITGSLENYNFPACTQSMYVCMYVRMDNNSFEEKQPSWKSEHYIKWISSLFLLLLFF